MYEWDNEMAALEKCEALYRVTGERPMKRRLCFGWVGRKYDGITHHLSRIKMLEKAITDARKEAQMQSNATPSWFVFFR